MNSAGEIRWIGLRPSKGAKVVNVNLARVEKSAGLEGDHYSGQSGNRQLTFVLETDLIEIGRLLKADSVHPEKTRRNLLVIGLKPEDLLPGAKCKIGNSAIIEITGFCHPCKRMNETIGPGCRGSNEKPRRLYRQNSRRWPCKNRGSNSGTAPIIPCDHVLVLNNCWFSD